MSIFSGMSESSSTSRYPFLTPGNYRARIAGVEMKKGKDPSKSSTFGKNMVVVEFQVTESFGEAASPAHATYAWMAIEGPMFLPNCKGLFDAAFPEASGLDKKEYDAFAAAVFQGGGDWSLVGQEVNIQVNTTKTKAGRDFNAHNFSAVVRDA